MELLFGDIVHTNNLLASEFEILKISSLRRNLQTDRCMPDYTRCVKMISSDIAGAAAVSCDIVNRSM
jgi:hypothetical protein